MDRASLPRAALLLSIATITLGGCFGAAMESGRISAALAERNRHMDSALAGDAEAQYRVGLSYCCAPRDDADAFYNNRKAIEFLCLAARQDHADAAFALGKIYAGDTIDGLRLWRRVATAMREDHLVDESVAAYWYGRAATGGLRAAADARDELPASAIPANADPAATPCTLAEVQAMGS